MRKPMNFGVSVSLERLIHNSKMSELRWFFCDCQGDRWVCFRAELPWLCHEGCLQDTSIVYIYEHILCCGILWTMELRLSDGDIIDKDGKVLEKCGSRCWVVIIRGLSRNWEEGVGRNEKGELWEGVRRELGYTRWEGEMKRRSIEK